MRRWMFENSWTWMLIGIPLGALLGVVLILTWGWTYSGVIGFVVGEVIGFRLWWYVVRNAA